MNNLKILKGNLKIIVLLIVFFVGIFLLKDRFFIPQPTNQPAEKKLTIVSTNPSSLEGATILPTQYIEISFNYPIRVSEFKHKIDPPLNHEVVAVNGKSDQYGQILRIVFKKPLQLGSGLTLFILGNTHTEDGLKLDQDFIYHIRTIGYRGV